MIFIQTQTIFWGCCCCYFCHQCCCCSWYWWCCWYCRCCFQHLFVCLVSVLDSKASNLSNMSSKYKKDAKYLNLRSSYAKIAAIVAVIVVFLLFIRFWILWGEWCSQFASNYRLQSIVHVVQLTWHEYCEIILFHGHGILWFDDNGHVRGHLNLWILNNKQYL